MNKYSFLSLSFILASAASAETTLSNPGAIDAYLNAAVANTHIPGLVAMAGDKDGVFYSHAAGLSNSVEARAMQESDIFRIASMTKPVTSVTVMMLVEEGKVSLDDPIGAHLPDLANWEVLVGFDGDNYRSRPARQEMTVRHLLTNTSGIAYTFSNADLVRMIGDTTPAPSTTSLPLVHEPGERWTYGESTRVLGRLVEVLSGQPLESFMRTRIFDPLGMTETSYSVPGEQTARVATVHRMTDAGLVEAPNPAVVSADAFGDGGLNSTAADYMKFIQMFLNNGRAPDGTQLLSEETVRTMGQNAIGDVRVTTQFSTNEYLSRDFPVGADCDSFGLGFQVTGEHDSGSMRAPGSMSWAGIFNTEFWIDPATGIGAVLLMQYLPFYDPAAIETLEGFEALVYEKLQ